MHSTHVQTALYICTSYLMGGAENVVQLSMQVEPMTDCSGTAARMYTSAWGMVVLHKTSLTGYIGADKRTSWIATV